MSEASDRQTRLARQAEALRANLARRKAQSRARADVVPPPAPSDEPGPVSSDPSSSTE